MGQHITKNVVILACIIGATAVACTGNDGWGWLMFLAFLLT